MNLIVWYWALFLSGVALMGICYLFIKACEKI
jgi:hypothetical protein